MFKSKELTLTLLIGSALLSGCASSSDWLLGRSDCAQIGCGKDLEFYPSERGGATRIARDVYGWDWGTTSSACKFDDEECIQTRRAKEMAEGNTPWHWNQDPYKK
jgi:hypothetical protein